MRACLEEGGLGIDLDGLSTFTPSGKVSNTHL